MTVISVIIKALNEERRIAACLEAALKATRELDAEVIVVDSLSDDRTVEIAQGFPVRVVRIDDAACRGCGSAVEVGWRFSRGDCIYVLDADMLLERDFPRLALQYLAAHEDVAGVGGKLVDTRLNTLADEFRARRASSLQALREVDDLGGGGLYRRRAVEQAGYLAHRSLLAYEEAELAVRLRALGWRLVRLPQIAVRHEGHAESNCQMMRRLWRNGRASSPALFLRSAFGRPWFGLTLRKLAHIVAVPVLHGAALALALAVGARWGLAAGSGAWLAAWAGVVALFARRKRSLRIGLWNLCLWHYWAAGTVRGLRRPLLDPLSAIPATELARQTRADAHG